MLAALRRPAGIALLSFLLLLVWDASGADMALARLFGGAQGFALRDQWLLANVLHEGARRFSWMLVLGLCLLAMWPRGALAQLPLSRRIQMPATALAATAVVVALKSMSKTSCPWDLTDFGGVAAHISHWRGWFMADGGGGRCFPAGHASSGFAFLGCYFALRGQLPRAARAALLATLAFGLLLGLVQQVRGAHFMSHTLWTAWLCGMTAWLMDPLFEPRGSRAAALT